MEWINVFPLPNLSEIASHDAKVEPIPSQTTTIFQEDLNSVPNKHIDYLTTRDWNFATYSANGNILWMTQILSGAGSANYQLWPATLKQIHDLEFVLEGFPINRAIHDARIFEEVDE